ncbi:MAG TPA: zinc ribbon domain-containing protein [Xanthomonadaceae bacterium]|nr:zinc ribbon domain-containing protein [Xanthomonadaceae bacterium]
MPIYEFECSACGHVFDRLQKLSDPDPAACPDCSDGPIRRRVTAPSFRLAGSGWYETDFKGEKDARRNLAARDEAPKPEPSGTGAEPKAAPQAEPKATPKGEPKAAPEPGPKAGKAAAA